MFSLLCEGDVRPPSCTTGPATKKGETPESALSAGDFVGGLLEACDELSDLIHGPEGRCSEIAESTGDRVVGESLDISCCPSAWKNCVFFGSCCFCTSLAWKKRLSMLLSVAKGGLRSKRPGCRTSGDCDCDCAPLEVSLTSVLRSGA